LNKQTILNIALRFYKLAIVGLIVVGFFSFYNIFLIDSTLENLKYSLEQAVVAYDMEDVNGLDMLIAKAISKEIPPYNMISRNSVVNLEFAKNIVDEGKSFRQLSHMKVALGSAIEEKEQERGFFLSLIDKINRPIREGFMHLAYIVQSFFRPKPVEKPVAEIDVDLFTEFRELEKGKSLKDLISNYSGFIQDHPDYRGVSLAKLKLAYTYQRLGEYDVATKLYNEVIREHPNTKESNIANVFLDTLKRKSESLKKINLLIVESHKLPDLKIVEKQEIFYKIGKIYLELFNLKEATKFFQRAVSLSPESLMATKAQYSMAWLLKEQKDLEGSLAIYSKLAADRPDDTMAFDSLYQVATIQHAKGNHEEFISLSLKLAEQYKAYPTIASLCLFQAGASYMYDLNNLKKANEIFARLVKEFPGTAYAQYLAPVSPVGVFVTYLVPRATRVVAWRIMGLLCLSGYTGEIFKFTADSEEAGFNLGFNNWLKKELPDTVGNIYVDIRGQETDFEKGIATSEARITMGQFNVFAHGEWALGVTEGRALDLIVKKAFLEKIPIPPVLLNNSLKGVKKVIEKNFPVEISSASVRKDSAQVEGYGSMAALNRLKKDIETLFLADFKIMEIKDPAERQRVYDLFEKKFPEGDFSVTPKRDIEALFLDFFTRISLYATFKILETVKDSKLDFERSIRTLGRLMMKEENFRINFKETYINADLARFIYSEFPWVIDNKFMVDIKSLEADFKDDGYVDFTMYLGLAYGDGAQALRPSDIIAKGKMMFEIDPESGIPRWVFKDLNLNDKPFSLLDKVNMVTLRCFNMLKDENVPITIEDITLTDNTIIFKGKGAGDFTARLFYDPHPFVIFQIRREDLGMAGVKRIKPMGADKGAYYFRGRTIEGLKQPEVRKKALEGVQKQYLSPAK